MIGHIPRNTRIFIGLSIITLLLMYLAITLSDLQGSSFLSRNTYTGVRIKTPEPTMDISAWTAYDDPQYPIRFQKPADWQISTATLDDNYYDITLSPANESPAIHIFVSEVGYLGFAGLNTQTAKFGNYDGVKINDSLIGIKANQYFYTFDATMNPDLAKEFAALMSTIQFD